MYGVVREIPRAAPTRRRRRTVALDGQAAIGTPRRLGIQNQACAVTTMPTASCSIETCRHRFAAGTQISTSRGDVRVELLRVGDTVATRIGGAFRTVRWLGFRTVDIARHPHWTDWAPVRITRDAFGAGLPRRALYLSPDHAVFADGVLIPIKYLVNGGTVGRMRRPSDHLLAHRAGYARCGDGRRSANGELSRHRRLLPFAKQRGGCATPSLVQFAYLGSPRMRAPGCHRSDRGEAPPAAATPRRSALRDRKRKLAA